jgi:hypothetical protein
MLIIFRVNVGTIAGKVLHGWMVSTRHLEVDMATHGKAAGTYAGPLPRT